MNLINKLKLADFVTLLGVVFITIAFWFLSKNELELASASALVAVLFDFMDGKVARKYGSSEYGKYLDSLFDVSGFVVFPTLLIMSVRGGDIISLVVAVSYSIAAYLRLARFTAHGLPEGARHYQGMPVLYSVFAIMLYQIAEGTLSLAVLIMMTPVMISETKVHKPGHPIYGLVLITVAIWLVYAR